ncbi:MAG: sulfatase-like hydrolase/transferase [Bryobacteraceae bacterium]
MRSSSGSTRRALLAGMPAALTAAAASAPTGAAAKPNIVLVISDQFRADCLGSLGLNPMNLTPNLDGMASRGVVFRSAFANQPVCAPARGSIFTGQYPARHGVVQNGIALPPGTPTLATTLRAAGYSANYIGKWHLAGDVRAAAPPAARGGFLDLWEASNLLEFTSHAYEGDLFDNAGRPIHFANRYRADFLTDRVERFLRGAHRPFLLVASYLEVHHQNDSDTFDPPREFKNRYPNPFVPQDLRPLPGTWPSQLADYFACVAKMDEVVGRIRGVLADTGLDRDTILVFVSDHGCHFKTRNTEYKRSPHDSSLHIPLVMEGPGFNRNLAIPELVSQVDLTPTLLAACGVPAPPGVQGRSFLPLLDRQTTGWRDEVYFELSEFVLGRGLRTPQYTYAVAAPRQGDRLPERAGRYVEYMLYDNDADPWQQVNLAGRAPYAKVAEDLRARLAERMKEAAGETTAIEPCWFPYP